MSEVRIPGPVGQLEGKIHKYGEESAPLVVILHPHPLHGGTMNNKVVFTIFKAFRDARFNVLRFNFRGVGKSQGKAIGGDEELDDALAALDWFIKKCPENSQIWIAGFSFGGWAALNIAMRRPEITGFVAVSPAKYPLNMLTPCPSGLIVQGESDHIVATAEAKDIADKLVRQKGSEIEFISFDADHYYTDSLKTLEDHISNYLEDRIF